MRAEKQAAVRAAIVTGATAGIGEAVARSLYAEGYHTLLVGRSQVRGEALASCLGERARFLQADITEPGRPKLIVDQALAFAGRVDVLVNNAGIDHTGDILDAPLEDVREVFETNTFAALAMLQAAACAMSTGGGSIINITSRLASVGVATMGVYAASKGAVLAMTKSAAVELASHNIRVNAVAPGMTRTPLYEDWLASLPDPRSAEEEVVAGIPLRRVAKVEDVAAAVAFLASEKASYITGVSLPVDGGYTAA